MTNPSLPLAVIFDMDGLLVDSEPIWAVAESEMLARRGKTYAPEINLQFVGLRPKDFIAGLHQAYGLTDEVPALVKEVTARMVELIYERDVVQCPGAPELLDYLKAQQVPCAIASSSPIPVIEAVLTKNGWKHYFRTIASGDEVLHGKPSPEIYLLAAQQLDVKPEICLTFEDSPTGARAAVAAGMTCYAVPDLGHTRVEAFNGVTPHVFRSLHDVLKLIRNEG